MWFVDLAYTNKKISVLMAQLDRVHIEPIMKEIMGMISVDVAIDKPAADGYKSVFKVKSIFRGSRQWKGLPFQHLCSRNFLLLRLINILMSKCEEDMDGASKGEKSASIQKTDTAAGTEEKK